MKKINSVLQLISSLRILLGPFSSFKVAEAFPASDFSLIHRMCTVQVLLPFWGTLVRRLGGSLTEHLLSPGSSFLGRMMQGRVR